MFVALLLATVRFVTIDPGHFHAALVQKSSYPDVSDEVRVFAPEGPELASHLEFIKAFNSRKDEPTGWRENVYRGADYLAAFRRYAETLADPERSVVVLAGRNDLKADYALAAVEAGMNVLADKPLAIDADGCRKLEKAVGLARQKGLAFMDLMTDRADIHIRLADALVHDAEIFGDLKKGSPLDPSVISESSHHFLKNINGAPLRRPAWYYDVTRQGEGIVDVTTHIVDGLQRTICPGRALSAADVRVTGARTWDTFLTADEYRESTGLGSWPDFLKPCVGADNRLACRANGEFTFSLDGVHARVGVVWNVRDTVGDGDVAAASFKGTKCMVRMMPDAGHGVDMAVFVQLYELRDRPKLASSVDRAVARLQEMIPGVRAVATPVGWRFDVPPYCVVSHDPSFAAFTKNFLRWVGNRNQPAEEYANLLVKYRTLADAWTLSKVRPPKRPAAVRTIVPTPVAVRFTGEEVEIDGFRPTGTVPASLAERIGRLPKGTCPLEFVLASGRGSQAYAICAQKDKVTVEAGDEVGAIYACSTLRQMIRPADGRWSLALGTVEDRPAFAVRGVNWNLFVEARGWSQDEGLGEADFRRRFVAGLDTLADFKLNAAIVDGTGWNPERFPGYGRLMRSLSAEARKRGIKLGYVGYSEGYGAQWFDSDGPKFTNRRGYPDGKVYSCFGLNDSPQGEMGTCLSNDELMRLKCENLRAFVKAVEPGFLYVHGADLNIRDEMLEAWSNRCEACRRRWPNDDTTAADGAAGALAHLYDSLKDAVDSVKNPETGYDAARDCTFMAVAPNYTRVDEPDDEWRYHVDYFRTLSATLRHHDIVLLLREQYAGEDGKARFPQLRDAVGTNAKLAVLEFCAGDGFLNCTPATGEMALTRYFKGLDCVLVGGGNAFMEPRQVLWSEYMWNPSGSAYAWESGIGDLNDSVALYSRLSLGKVAPEPIFNEEDGLLRIACRKLYGERAGDLAVGAFSLQHMGIPGYEDAVSLIMPLASERLPGTRFSRFRFRRGPRVLRWREDLDEVDMITFRREIATERASVAKTRAAAATFRRAAQSCTDRRESLLRMADCCETGAALGDLVVTWLDLVVREFAYVRGLGGTYAELDRDLVRFEREAARWLAHFDALGKKTLDASGANAHDGWMTAEYLQKEAVNLRETLTTGKYLKHEIRSWW